MSATNVKQPVASSEHERYEKSHRQQNYGKTKASGPRDANKSRNEVGSACIQAYTEDQEKQTALGKLREGQAYDDEDLEKYETFQNDNYDIEGHNKAQEKYVFFWRSHDIYSQWNTQGKFYVHGQQFNCTEQYMMYKKAGNLIIYK